VIIQSGDFTEVVSVGGIDNVRGKSGSEGIVDLDSDIINSWLGAIVEVSVDSDSVGELDGWERCHVWDD